MTRRRLISMSLALLATVIVAVVSATVASAGVKPSDECFRPAKSQAMCW